MDIVSKFRVLRNKANATLSVFTDEQLLTLLDVKGIPLKPRDLKYLGFGHVQNEHFHYVYGECEDSALLTVKSVVGRETNSYILTQIGLTPSKDLSRLLGLSFAPRTEGYRFKEVVVGGTGITQSEVYLLNGLMDDFIGARNDSFAN